ncbi:MAG TPA: NUDIX hydrolase, partial [Methylovirgula sp.]
GPPRIETVADIAYQLDETQAWAFERDRAGEIEAHWQKRLARNPHLFDGRVLLMRQAEIIERDGARRLQGTCFSAAYKSFMAWRDFGFPESGVANVFGMAALRSADGAFLLGEMASTTANAGDIYFPAGTPDPKDLKDGSIDFEGSVLRELKEETGLGQDSVRLDAGWTIVFYGAYIACMKAMRSSLSAAEILARVDGFLAREKHPELARLKPVVSPADFDQDHMPEFTRAYMRHVWERVEPN